MIRISTVLIIISANVCLWTACGPLPPSGGPVDSSSVARAFEQKEKDVQVVGEGIVTRILADDTSGLPHQRFILKLVSGQTVLIEHNTDLAGRISGLSVGDTVSFSGEYVWNEQGGLIHWTHHDPAGRHTAGWLRHNSQLYQ